ncbi:MAG: DUF2905 domain-containing protein [Flavobacteriales bacterium]|nr:MAG: DUF2905 domain-containing protein [Flavobacteriales bacterium]
MGKLLIVLGVLLIIIGILYQFGWLHWLGRLPGDIRWEKGSTRVYFPLTTMILLSLALSLITYFFKK